MRTDQQIQLLEWTMFGRIGLMFMASYNPKENNKIRADIRKAKKDNNETDSFIRAYIKENKNLHEYLSPEELPF